ncbi:MAG: hypothetical protein OCC49_11700, partial [Fibrobacterales bacterium]
RCRPDVVSEEMTGKTTELIRSMAAYSRSEDLINIGAYVTGSDPDVDLAIQRMGPINDFLRQGMGEKFGPVEIEERINELAGIQI